MLRVLFERNISAQPDRRFLEGRVIPFLGDAGMQVALFVGCRSYTRHYPRMFQEQGITLYTCDIDPDAARFGSPGRHQTLDALDLTRRHFPEHLDAIVFSGVLGFGMNTVAQAEAAAPVFADLLAPGGLLILGWNSDRAADMVANPVWQARFKRTAHAGMAQRVTFETSTHVFDVLERKSSHALKARLPTTVTSN